MVVAQDHIGDVREIDAQLAGVLEHGFGVKARVEQDPAPVGFHQCGEAPLPHSVLGQHGRKDGDLERCDLVERWFCRGSTYRARGYAQTGDQRDERAEHTVSFAVANSASSVVSGGDQYWLNTA